ncbi:hypothetical protein ACFOWM_08825 [Ferruginibacter yonginensis]|uniref:Uncharacterized protein n=1 Tax=Ferruginibacter yonginensis TaxID=1310416 RepID=A0ABV8QUB2_9BACT
MKKVCLFFIITLFFNIYVNAQTQRTLKQVLVLQMPKTIDDDMPGTTGSSVAWHPIFKKYYACFAGNVEYPFGVFDEKGNLLSDPNLSCNNDVRGLWYSPINRTIAGNAYNDGGWFEYKLDNKGMVKETKTVLEKMNQPEEQSVGCYNTAENKILFLDGPVIKQYDTKGYAEKTIDIYWGQSKKPQEATMFDELPVEYNTRNIVYAAKPQSMIGALNIDNNSVEWYSLKTGLLIRKDNLPQSAPAPESFNFAYANDIVWLFDKENRRWLGYK